MQTRTTLPSSSHPCGSHGGPPAQRCYGAKASGRCVHPPISVALFPPVGDPRSAELNETRTLQVADLGCGSGALLQLLAVPANHSDDFPASLYPPSPVSESPSGCTIETNRRLRLDKVRAVPRLNPNDSELHLRRLVGVDLRKESLENAIHVVEPPAPRVEGEGTGEESERWEEMRCEIWEGGLEVYNEALEQMEAMVVTEVRSVFSESYQQNRTDAVHILQVIEHMTAPALAKFGTIVLGGYRPRVVVVTTPNHEFNPYFISSSAEQESQNRFPDPTGRTNRVFRDDDHQFEWTQSEFRNWACLIADENDYEVSFSGVGSLAHYYGQGSLPIPFPPPSLSAHPALHDSPTSLALPSDPTQFFATQIATFKLHYSNIPERSPRSHRTTPLPFFSPVSSPLSSPASIESKSLPAMPTSPNLQDTNSLPKLVHRKSISPTPHTLLKFNLHPPHPAAGSPVEGSEILKLLERLFRSYFRSPSATLREIWNQREVRVAAGGAIGVVVDCIVEEEEGEWDFEVLGQDGERGDEALRIIWKAWTGAEVKSSDEESGEDEGEEETEEDNGEFSINEWEGEVDDPAVVEGVWGNGTIVEEGAVGSASAGTW